MDSKNASTSYYYCVKKYFDIICLCHFLFFQHMRNPLENALILFTYVILFSFSTRGIPWSNLIAFSSDNCSVMRGRHNSVLSRIKNVQPDVLDIGSICHLANLCCVHAVKQLPLPVEELLIDVYFNFSNSAKRKEKYRECFRVHGHRTNEDPHACQHTVAKLREMC